MKQIFLFLWLLCSLATHAQRTYTGITKVSFFGLNAAGLTAALAAVNNVEIDKNITIASTVLIPYGKIVIVNPGAIITATAQLTIGGQIYAPLNRIFADGSIIKFEQFAAPQEVYPEWFGAKVMETPRNVQ